MARRQYKQPGEYKEQITVTLRADLMEKLPRRRGATSELIARLLLEHFNQLERGIYANLER